MHPPPSLRLLAGTDIYLLDQILRGRIRANLRVLDAGCGTGRNLRYLMASGCETFGVDEDAAAIAAVRAMAAELAPGLPPENFRCEPVDGMTLPEHTVDVVISNAVLHFARDEAHFGCMIDAMWRVLRPGGLLFSRLASTIGIVGELRSLGGRRFRQPDGDERFLVDEALLDEVQARLNAEPADPLKTTVVRHRRAMTTWVVRKRQ